jgi:hypothetical protein
MVISCLTAMFRLLMNVNAGGMAMLSACLIAIFA